MKIGLRARLIGAIVGAVLLIFLCCLIASRLVLQRDLYELGRTEVTSAASAFAGYVGAKQQQIQLLVSQEAASDALRAAMQSHNAAAIAQQLSDVAGSSGLSFLTVVDVNGRVLGRAHAPAGGSLATDPIVSRSLSGETVTTVARLPRPFLQNEGLALQAGAQSDGLAIVAATPVSDAQERTIGALYGGVLLNHSYDLVDEASRAIGGTTAILDRDTIVSSSIQNPDGTRLVDAGVPAADAVLRTNTPFVGADTEGGVTYLARIDPIADDQGHVLGGAWYGIPMSFITSIVAHTTEALVLWGLAATVLVIALAIPTVRALSKTIIANSRRVRETAKELGVVIVGSEVSGDHIAATKRCVEQSGRVITELASEQPSPKLAELQRLNAELEGDVTVIETLAQEMSSRTNDAVGRVAELNQVAAALNELVTGESSTA